MDEAMKQQLAEVGRIYKLADTLKFQTGEIILKNGEVKITLTDKFRFIDAKDSKTVLVDIWGNPPESASGILGMLFPADADILQTWAIPIEATDDGYVKDEEFDKVDFNKMKKELMEASVEASKERERRGFGKMILMDWAEPPHYERATHKLYWAKKYDIGNPQDFGLNYDIRILGRKGTLDLSVVGGMSQFDEIKAATPDILKMVEFQPGCRYEDFDAKTDKLATYGIAGLIAGGILTKGGLFKMLPLLIAKFWKIGLVAIIAIGALVKKNHGSTAGEKCLPE